MKHLKIFENYEDGILFDELEELLFDIKLLDHLDVDIDQYENERIVIRIHTKESIQHEINKSSINFKDIEDTIFRIKDFVKLNKKHIRGFYSCNKGSFSFNLANEKTSTKKLNIDDLFVVAMTISNKKLNICSVINNDLKIFENNDKPDEDVVRDILIELFDDNFDNEFDIELDVRGYKVLKMGKKHMIQIIVKQIQRNTWIVF